MTLQQKHLIVGTALGYFLNKEATYICHAIQRARIIYKCDLDISLPDSLSDLGVSKYEPFELYSDLIWFSLDEIGREQRIELLRKVLKDIEKEMQNDN